MTDLRITIESWCACGGAMTANVGSIEAMNAMKSAFLSVHEGPGCGPATKEQAAAVRRKQDRRRS